MIDKRVFQVISRLFNVLLEEVDRNSSPETIAPWDSLQHMNLILALEEEFGIRFADEQVIDMDTVDKIITAVEGTLAGANS